MADFNAHVDNDDNKWTGMTGDFNLQQSRSYGEQLLSLALVGYWKY